MMVMAQHSILEGNCVTVNCRGMALLGFTCAGTIYFCVHQLSVELWKLYDTPRVSVQKKILDLHIQLMNCNKEQIKLLRKAGIIENFRATMIEIRDTERLFDALEHSRRKRGLQKHPLKTKSDPSERALRVEEKRARRLEERAKPLNLLPCDNSVLLRLANYEGSGCALDRVSWGVRTPQSQEPFQVGVAEVPTDVPLVVEDAVEVESIGGELCIEVDVNIAGELDPHPNSVSLQRMEHSPSITPRQDPLLGSSSTLQLSTGHRYANFLEPPKSPECFSDAGSFSHSPRHLNRHTSRLSSPAFESSELEERSSIYSFGRSSSASPRRLSATPERFLLLDSDLESDISESSEVFLIDSLSVGHKKTKTVCREPQPPLHTQAFSLTAGRVNHTYRKPTVTKLRHFAKATSPNSTYRQLLVSSRKQEEVTQSTSSLVVSIPLSMLRSRHSDKQSVVSKPRRVTLSSFASKKRASSRTPSCSSDSSYEPPGTKRVGSATMRGRGIARFSGKGGGIPVNRVVTRPRRNTYAGKDMEVEPVNGTSKLRDVAKRHSLLSESSKHLANLDVAVNGKPGVLQTHRDSLDNGSNSHQEDDQLSITSSSTNSTNNSISGRVRTKGTAKAGRHVTVTKPTFSFDELFSYYPPKLVLIDDELQPAQSLSVKGLDRHSLPEAHPFLKWTLGQPVRSLTTSRKKRKNYANGNGQKSSGGTQ